MPTFQKNAQRVAKQGRFLYNRYGPSLLILISILGTVTLGWYGASLIWPNIVAWPPWALGAAPGEETPTTFDFAIYNINGTVMDGDTSGDIDHDEGAIALYEYEVEDPETWTISDYDDLAFADFTLAKEDINHDDSYTIDADTYYLAKANCTSFGDYWFIPIAGLNTIYLTKVPTDTNLACVSTEASNTLAATNDLYWTGFLYMQDVDEEVNEEIGYSPHYDFSNIVRMDEIEDAMVYNVIVFDFNCSAIDKNDVELTGLTVHDILIDDDEIQIFVEESLLGFTQFDFELDEDELGIAWELASVSFCTGQLGETLTQKVIDT
jgi:hypothetical protein